MSDKLTLVCPTGDRSVFESALRSVANQNPLESVGDAGALAVRFPSSSVVFSFLPYERPGDQFSDIMMGMSTFFNRVATEHVDVRKNVVSAITKADSFIGIVVEPALDANKAHFDLVFGLAGELNCLIFVGGAVLTSAGDLLLDSEGRSGGDDAE